MEMTIIQNKIYTIRGHKIMLDYDLSELYSVETKRLNEQVRRNKERFPEDFMFRLTEKEWETMRSQIVTGSEQTMMRSQIATASQKKRNASATPYAFTEHGVTMLASVLRSPSAVQMNISIVRAFIALKQFADRYKELTDKIEPLFERLNEHDIQLSKIYDVLENMLDKE